MPYKDKAKQTAYQARWMQARRLQWIAEHGPCVDCGSWEYPEVDHVDPSLKVTHRVWGWTERRRAVELEKCVVRCHDCHSGKTAKARLPVFEHGTYRTYETHGCRCELCKKANADYRRDVRARTGRH